MTLLVAPVAHRAARYAVENWHYSRCMPAPPCVCYGVWENDRYIGVVIFSRGASDALVRPYGLDAVQGAELTRVALREHDAPVSQIVSLAVKRLRKSSPGLRMLVSFADPFQGHHGGIYQAMGWIYAGTTPKSKAYRDSDGRMYHPRVISAKGYVKQFGVYKRVRKPSEFTEIVVPGKYRYLLPLDRAMRKQVAKLSKPYPTRGRSVEGDAPVVLTGEASSTLADRS